MDALGDDHSPEAKMLRDVLKKAQQCAQFVERARNRLSRAVEALRKAQDERVRLELEWRDGEQRLEAPSGGFRAAHTTGGPGDEISKMQKLVELNQIAAQRDALSQELRRSCPKGEVVGWRWSTTFEQRPWQLKSG